MSSDIVNGIEVSENCEVLSAGGSSHATETSGNRKKNKKKKDRERRGSAYSSASGQSNVTKASRSGESTTTMRKYGKIPFRATIKRGKMGESIQHDGGLEEKKLKNESVGDFVKREVWENGPVGHSIHLTEESKKLTEFSLTLHNELLHDEVKTLGFDRFDSQYDPQGDAMMTKSFNDVRKEEIRAANDTGPSISKERFTSKSWGAWRKDVIVLEKTSEKEIQVKKVELSRIEILQNKKKNMAKYIQKSMPSLLQGTTFAVPKSDAPDFFDHHMQGNRNTPSKIHEYSLGVPVPKTFTQPALLNAADIDPNRFGASISGGVVAQGPARGVNLLTVTASIDFPVVDQPKRDAKFLSFPLANRSTKVPLANVSGDGAKENKYDSPSKMPGNKFGDEKRTGGIPDTRKDYPGPGTYSVQGLFDKFDVPDYQQVIDKIASKGSDFRSIAPHDLAKIAGFGHGCNRQEHILYGFCLDGLCSKRVEFERAFLQTKNHVRLGAESKEACIAVLPGKELITKKVRKEVVEKKPDLDIFNIDSKAAMDRLQKKYNQKDRVAKDKKEFILSLVSDPKEYMYPLHMAALRCDIPAIRKMKVLNLDVNFTQGEREETPVHLAVRNQHLKAVQCIAEVFDGIVDVNIQNNLGDTALHIASRKGFKEIVEALCDAGSDPWLKNDEGCTPLMTASVFTIQQLLRMQQDIFTMKKELDDVNHQLVLEKKKASVIDKRAENGGMTLDDYMGSEGALRSADEEFISAADMIQYPWRAQIASRGGGTAPASRASSTQSTRSRILEVTKNTYDKDVDESKTNMSLFRVKRSKTMLKNPKMNSFVLGYFADDMEK
jgi:hypothetical protein